MLYNNISYIGMYTQHIGLRTGRADQAHTT